MFLMQLLTVSWMADGISEESKVMSLICVERVWYGVLAEKTDKRSRISSVSAERRCLLILGAAISYFTFFYTLTQPSTQRLQQ
ncbi:hypothetical protein B566_EDAN004908 [Ephemera danica]|nr:hypothetical protein B566_EDAN004908 [Ephemera danica]